MATKREAILYSAANVNDTVTGDWIELSDSMKGAFVVVKADARTAGTLTAVIQTSAENGTPNAPIEIVGSLVLDASNLIRISDQTAKSFAKYARVTLTSSSADFDDVLVYLQYQ